MSVLNTLAATLKGKEGLKHLPIHFLFQTKQTYLNISPVYINTISKYNICARKGLIEQIDRLTETQKEQKVSNSLDCFPMVFRRGNLIVAGAKKR